MMTPCSLDVDYDANDIQEYIISHVANILYNRINQVYFQHTCSYAVWPF